MSANFLSFSITYDQNNKNACNSETPLVMNTKLFSNSLFESEAVSISMHLCQHPLRYNMHMRPFCYIMRLWSCSFCVFHRAVPSYWLLTPSTCSLTWWDVNRRRQIYRQLYNIYRYRDLWVQICQCSSQYQQTVVSMAGPKYIF